MSFQPPLSEIGFCLKHIAGLEDGVKRGLYGDLDMGLADAVLEEAAKFAAEVLAPLNRAGDKEGARLENGRVKMPAGWADAYKKWFEAGWPALAGPTEFGGQAMPQTLALAVAELWNQASLAFGLSPLLTQSAVEAVKQHGTNDLKNLYLEKLVTGAWTGAMLLTEPQAGTDLGALTTRAKRADDGSYLLYGSKIFITYGDHDLTENIVHLVLARLEDAPVGTRGISMFLVPSVLLGADGHLAARNDIHASALEHKLGIHASPTCVMNLGDGEGARGWLVGSENQGLAHMFTMMNHSRLAVGLQGVAIAERAMQLAVSYASERKQGRRPDTKTDERAPIEQHPDVARMILTMQAKTAAARAVCYRTAEALDMQQLGATDAQRAQGAERLAFLTPLAKFLGTETGVEVADLALQVHGGMGYIEETGAAQHFRDARILPIYEGTNGVQALDLVARKLPMRDGLALHDFIGELNEIADAAHQHENDDLNYCGRQISLAVSDLVEASEMLVGLRQDDPDGMLFAATPYCALMALCAGGAYLLKGALAGKISEDGAAGNQCRLVRFFAEHIAADSEGLKLKVARSSGAYMTGQRQKANA